MAAASNTVSPLEAARNELEEQRSQLAVWEAERTTAAGELETLHASAGELALETPEAGRKAARDMAELRDRIDIAERAAETLRERVATTERAFLLEAADESDKTLLREPQKRLKAHEDRTAELLQLLEQHEGEYILREQMIEMIPADRRMGMSWKTLKSKEIRLEVARAGIPGRMLRAVATGEDVGPIVTEASELKLDELSTYTAFMWGPSAVVPAPGYLAAVERARTTVAELEDLAERLPGEIEELEQQQRFQSAPVPGLERRRSRLADVDRELSAARAALTVLVKE